MHTNQASAYVLISLIYKSGFVWSKTFLVPRINAGHVRGALCTLCALAHSIFKKLCAKSALSTFLVRYVRYWVKKGTLLSLISNLFLVRYVRYFQLVLL